jgi:uncharacterized protein (TIGR02466 family)
VFGEKQTIHLFPYPVWLFAVEPNKAETVNQKALAYIEQTRDSQPEGQSDNHWQSSNDLQTLSEFEELCEVIKSATRDIFQQLCINTDKFLITGCWINLRPPGSEHPPHTHPNNYLSGSYYVETPKGGDAIIFRDPRIETNIIAPPVSKQTEYNSRTIMVPLESGRLVMFPSSLPHFVPPNQGNTDRISISFNIMFESYGETISKPMWTFDSKQ